MPSPRFLGQPATLHPTSPSTLRNTTRRDRVAPATLSSPSTLRAYARCCPSLVGPRPLPLYEVEAFSEFSHRRRLSVNPGITCEWQVGGRNKISSFEDWVAMDLRYIDNWSLWLDFTILLRTIPAVLFGHGAK